MGEVLDQQKKSLPESFSLPEAVNYLEAEFLKTHRQKKFSEKTIRRFIKAEKIEADKVLHRGKWRWMIKRWVLNRFVLDDWVNRQLSDVPPLEGYHGDLGPRSVYGRMEDRLSTVELTVSLEDFWRFKCKPIESREDYETIKEELRSRIPGGPENFQVRYRLDQETYQTLQQIIRRVPIPRPLRNEAEDLRSDALRHLIETTLPSFRQVKESWVAYLCQSVRNFYVDQLRKGSKFPFAIADLDDLDRLQQKVTMSEEEDPSE